MIRPRENKWQEAADVLLERHGVVVSRWRKTMSGVSYGDSNEIETPRPRSSISFAILAHEVGHQVLHKGKPRGPRYQEEVEAWEFALKAIQEFDLPGYERVERKARRMIGYSFQKAMRRGVHPRTIAEQYPTWWR